jgi:hypothetical protein
MPRRNYSKNSQKTQKTSLMSISGLANCQKKRRFSTEIKARQAAEIQELANPNLSIDIYRCEWCKNWHLTSKNSK